MVRPPLAAAAALILVSGLVGCWTVNSFSNPVATCAQQSPGQFAGLRELIEPLPDALTASKPDPTGEKQQVELDCRVFTVATSLAQDPVFARSIPDELIAGRLRLLDAEGFERALCLVGGDNVEKESRPQLEVQSGEVANFHGAFALACGGSLYYTVIWWPAKIIFDIKPIVENEDGLVLDISAGLGRLKPQYTPGCFRSDDPRFKLGEEELYEMTAKGKTCVHCRSGDTLVVGGLRQNLLQRRTMSIPALSSLPAVGSWFSYDWPESIEEELVLVVTPRLLNATAPK